MKQNPRAHVVYVSSEQFVQEFLDAIRFKKNTDFADYYRSADVLIIDVLLISPVRPTRSLARLDRPMPACPQTQGPMMQQTGMLGTRSWKLIVTNVVGFHIATE